MLRSNISKPSSPKILCIDYLLTGVLMVFSGITTARPAHSGTQVLHKVLKKKTMGTIFKICFSPEKEAFSKYHVFSPEKEACEREEDVTCSIQAKGVEGEKVFSLVVFVFVVCCCFFLFFAGSLLIPPKVQQHVNQCLLFADTGCVTQLTSPQHCLLSLCTILIYLCVETSICSFITIIIIFILII